MLTKQNSFLDIIKYIFFWGVGWLVHADWYNRGGMLKGISGKKTNMFKFYILLGSKII